MTIASVRPTDAAYELKRAREWQMYSHVSPDLDPDSLPTIMQYWAKKWAPKFEAAGFNEKGEAILGALRKRCLATDGIVQAVALGTGSADIEIEYCKRLEAEGITNFHIECLDFNPDLCAKAQVHIDSLGYGDRLRLKVADVNAWQASRQYDLVIAHFALHHFVELEDLFDEIKRSLVDDGLFLVEDVVGRNGHKRWPEAWPIVSSVWDNLDDKYKYNHQLNRLDKDTTFNEDCSEWAFEGIRAQDIMPLLLERFEFHQFASYANISECFFQWNYGPNFDINNEDDRAIVDRVSDLDDALIDSGVLKPCRMAAVMGKYAVPVVQQYKHWSPEFSTRASNSSIRFDSPSATLPAQVAPAIQRTETVSVIVMASGELDQTLRCIESVLDNGSQTATNIVVLDNGTPGEVYQPLADMSEMITVLRSDTPMEIASAWQAAMEQTTSKYVLCLTDELLLEAGTVDQLLSPVKRDAGIATSPQITAVDGTPVATRSFGEARGVCLAGNVEFWLMGGEVNAIVVSAATATAH